MIEVNAVVVVRIEGVQSAKSEIRTTVAAVKIPRQVITQAMRSPLKAPLI